MDKIRIDKKRIILFFAIAVLLLLFFSLSLPRQTFAFAEPEGYTPVVTVENKTVYSGQTFTLNVDLSNNEGILDLELKLVQYDRDVMELVGVKGGVELTDNALKKLTFTHTNPDNSLGYAAVDTFLWDGVSEADTGNGTILELTFESSATAPEGVYPVRMGFNINNTRKDEYQPLNVTVIDGSVTFKRGDFVAEYYSWDDQLLFRKDDYRDGDTPSYPFGQGNYDDKLIRESDEYYEYEFDKFEGIPADGEENVLKFRAKYILTPIEYQVFYFVDGINEESFDGVITEDDLWVGKTRNVGYGTYLENDYPEKPRYVFSGWYKDASFSKEYVETKMPAEDLTLYGYFVYDIRTTSIPKIMLTANVDEDEVTVTADMVMNTGFNAMVLTLSYDKSALSFSGFEPNNEVFSKMQFQTTNVVNDDYDGASSFKFYYNHTENSYETGVFVTMKFKIKRESEAGVYDVTFVMGNTDATYYNGIKGDRYTMIEIVPAKVPVGKIYKWEKSAEDSAEIAVESDLGMPADTALNVTYVPEDVHQITEETVVQAAGKNKEIKAVYDLTLVRISGNVVTEIAPDGSLTVEIKLTPEQRAYEGLGLYAVGENGEMVAYDFVREDDVIKFTTTRLGRWAIVGDKPFARGRLSDAAVMLISMPILLAIATMAYALILIGKNRKKKEKENMTND